MKKVAVITGTRAEYGLLKPIIKKIDENKKLELQLIVTGAHLSPEFGLTYKEIVSDGFKIIKRIEILLSSDTTIGVSKAMGLAIISFAEYFDEYKPDLVVILGDRYEMLAVASAAMIGKVPIAHIHGGELTEGAVDDAIRHSITKMSHLHFASTEEYRNRIIQLGENPDTVYNVGALGVENIKKLRLLTKQELEKDIDFVFSDQTILVTFHPVTLEKMTEERQFGNLLQVIDKNKRFRVIFTKANSDENGRIINQMIDNFVQENKERCISFTSMGQLKYLSALQFCCAVVGNSSSGLIEAPSFGIPTINIGDRQLGRVCAKSVINCGNDKKEIESAFVRIMDLGFREAIKNIKNPYEGEDTSRKILEVICHSLENGIDMKKKFYDINIG